MDRANATPGQMVLTVVLTCVISAAALSITYQLTAERIAEQERAAEVESLQAVLTDAETFVSREDLVEGAGGYADPVSVGALYEAFDSAGVSVGWGLRVAPRGYGGPISMVVGLDRDGQVLGVSIISNSETPGLGSKVLEDEEFMSQFTGWDGMAIDASAKAFDAVTGATKSSNGVRAGVLAAGRAYEGALQGVEPGEVPDDE